MVQYVGSLYCQGDEEPHTRTPKSQTGEVINEGSDTVKNTIPF